MTGIRLKQIEGGGRIHSDRDRIEDENGTRESERDKESVRLQ